MSAQLGSVPATATATRMIRCHDCFVYSLGVALITELHLHSWALYLPLPLPAPLPSPRITRSASLRELLDAGTA